MSILVVELAGEIRRLRPGMPPLTFGRDSTCTICLGADDTGISRLAGRIEHSGGSWWVRNLSRKRPLHVVDNNGTAVPVPPEASGWPSACRAVDGPLTVLIPGEFHTYRLILKPRGRLRHRKPSRPSNPISTKGQPPPWDDRQLAVLVALASGYLQPMPKYSPQPRSRAEVAEILACSEQEVEQAIAALGEALQREGVSGIEEDVDRCLCVWHLAMGHLRHEDLLVMRRRATITQSAINAEIGHFARIAARAIAILLEPQLRAVYGDNWLTSIHQKYPPPGPSTLTDSRYCLRVFVRDSSSHAFSTDEIRRQAHELLNLANRAAHDRRCTVPDARRAQHLYEIIVAALPDPAGLAE